MYFLAGGRPRQLVPTRLLRELAIELSGLPDWLFEDSYSIVGDLPDLLSEKVQRPDYDTYNAAVFGQHLSWIRGIQRLQKTPAAIINKLFESGLIAIGEFCDNQFARLHICLSVDEDKCSLCDACAYR